MKSWLQKALVRNRSKTFLRVNIFLVVVTVISIAAISLETMVELQAHQNIFDWIEYIAVSIFTVEFLARLYAKEDRKEYLLSFYGLIDIVSIVPTYLGISNLSFLKAARIVRLLRFLRMTRIAKLSRLNKYSNHNSHKAREIQMISVQIYGIVLTLSVFVFGVLFYVIENDNPFFKDIPSAVLWTAVTILGGGVDPHAFSIPARILVVCLQFSSLLLFGLLIAIVGRFVERRLLGSSSIQR